MAAGKSDELVLKAPHPRRDREALVDLVAKVHIVGGSYFSARDWCQAHYIGHSNYDWATTRVGFIGDRMVTHYGVWGYQMRIGSARVRVGGIGAVTTHADYRKRGLMAQTTLAAIDAMRANGYDLSLLFGIDNFYLRFGYISAWPEITYIAKVEELPSARPDVRLRAFAPRHRQDLAELYNAENAVRTGTAVRPTFLSGAAFHNTQQGFRWTDANGQTLGYVVCERAGQKLSHVDSAGDAVQRLRIIAMLARRWGCREAHLSALHHDDPLSKLLRRENCRAEVSYRRTGSAMVMVINLASALQQMAGELSRRLQASHLTDWRGPLLISSGREDVTLDIADRRVTVRLPGETPHAIRGKDEIAQLLIGSASPAEIAEASGTRLTGDAPALCAVLFPEQHPMLGAWDRF